MLAKFATININKRLVIVSMMIAVLAAGFWSGSRVPALNEKAIMGGDTQLEDPLSFEVLLVAQESDPLFKRIIYTAINWGNTNRKGMTFGILLGATFLTFLRLLRKRSYKSSFANTLVGFIAGTPLGVCVNCAAPIAQGLHDGGARLETTLATMVSSPTMNVIVLTMLFAVFPVYLALIKIGATLVFIFLLIPLLSRYVFRKEVASSSEAAVCMAGNCEIPVEESWLQALVGALRDFGSNLWYIIRITVPLMLLAGLLGATILNIVPLQSLATEKVTFFGILFAAIVGVFAPVPIAFDVIVSAALLSAGLPIIYVMLLLFTLGTYSIYSCMIIWRAISPRVALTLYAVVAVLGIISGFVADTYNQWELDRMLDVFGREAQAADLDLSTQSVRVTSRGFESRSPGSEKMFTRIEGGEMGLWRPNDFNVVDFWPPFYNGRGLASGDVHNDGWTDMLLATEHGILLYRNEAGKRFTEQKIDTPQLKDLNVFVVALVDVNNDGWLDIYLTSYRKGNFYILNDKGSFPRNNVRKTPTKNNQLTYALSFGDIDRDGDLDAAIGNWFYGFAKPVPPAESTNKLHFYDKDGYIEKPVDGITGETLSILLSDFNQDRNLDLLVGNDFVQPDIFSRGDGKGGFKVEERSTGKIPVSGETTMSIDTADIDNDLKPEIYIAQIAARGAGKAATLSVRNLESYCSDINDPGQKQACLRNTATRAFFLYNSKHNPSDIKKCRAIEDKVEQRSCMAMMIMKTAVRENKPGLCDKLRPEINAQAASLCHDYFKPSIETTTKEYQRSIPQRKNQNVLLVPDGGGAFVDQAEQQGIDVTGWSWNTRFADLDNDGWQDIYGANGTWLRADSVASNIYFHNEAGKGFTIRTDEAGLTNYMVVSAYTYFDMDNDGDLDIISNSVNGPVWVYKNNLRNNNSIAFQLRDHAGNHFGIGSRLIIHYADGAGQQMRELKSGGGFISFDSPDIYFGLGKYKQIDRVEIIWSTGEAETIKGPFPANARYLLERS